MKKIVILCSVLMLNTFLASATLVTLPDEATLTGRISRIMSQHFAEKTDLARTLAKIEATPLYVQTAIEFAVIDYLIDCPRKSLRISTRNKLLLIRALLEDRPDAIAELVSKGFLK